jgi:hypothetical protein
MTPRPGFSLSSETIPLLTRRDPARGWRALFDKLNEAKGYNYLTRIGCTNVGFIPRSQGQKTPDLEGFLGSERVLCEVKTINVSEDECEFRKGMFGVKNIVIQLPRQFLNKLESTLQTAQDQMAVYCPKAEKIAYVVVNYDDLFHEYEATYSRQLEQFVSARSISNMRVVFDAKPAFYSSTA